MNSSFQTVSVVTSARSTDGGKSDSKATSMLTGLGFRAENPSTPIIDRARPAKGHRFVLESETSPTGIGKFKLHSSHNGSGWKEILMGRITSVANGDVRVYKCVGGQFSQINFSTPEPINASSLADISTTSFSEDSETITVGDGGEEFFGEDRVLNISIDEILPFKFQPRIFFSEPRLATLAESLMEHGQNQPISVRILSEAEREKVGKEYKYEIVGGERRWRASKMNDAKTIKAIIKKVASNLLARLAAAYLDNTHREDLSLYEYILAVHNLVEPTGGDLTEINRITGLSFPLIRKYLSLRALNPEVLAHMSPEVPDVRRLRMVDAESLCMVKDHAEQMRVFRKAYHNIVTQGIRTARRVLTSEIAKVGEIPRTRSKNAAREAAGRSVMAVIDIIHTLNPDLLVGFTAFVNGQNAPTRIDLLGALKRAQGLLPDLIKIAETATNRKLQQMED
jgi:ParB/RepB/Spo0J family partition protein